MAKRILILGNGFDLAHGLPTRYGDFLDFSVCALAIYNFPGTLQEYSTHRLDTWDTGSDSVKDALKGMLKDLFEKRDKKNILTNDLIRTYGQCVHVNDRLDKFNEYLKGNIWYVYISELYSASKMRGENWIDFESEISYIIQVLDREHTSLSQSFCELHDVHNSSHGNDMEKFDIFYEACDMHYTGVGYNQTIGQLRERLYDDLENLILAFEIYLTDFVENIQFSTSISAIREIKPDCVISFNYTKTYENLYAIPGESICHIHGVCERDREEEKNDMVLGIDEYLPQAERSEKVDFAIFKKFVQRIRKRNDVSYVS